MHLQVITPDRTTFNDEVDEVTLPTTEGEITILPHHMPIVAGLAPGACRVKKGSEEYFLALAGGFVQIQPGNKIVVLADAAERAEELDEQKIQAARDAAAKVISEKRNANEVEYAALAATMQHELARLKVARTSRHKGAPNSAPEND